MPGQIIYEPNPPPDPSHIPDDVEKLAVQLNVKGFLSADERKGIEMFRRAADYIAAGACRQSCIGAKSI